VTTLALRGGRSVHLLTGGHMVNLAGPRPMGNSIKSMDLGFALQALPGSGRGRTGGAGRVVVPVPRFIDEQVAQGYLDLDREGRTT